MKLDAVPPWTVACDFRSVVVPNVWFSFAYRSLPTRRVPFRDEADDAGADAAPRQRGPLGIHGHARANARQICPNRTTRWYLRSVPRSTARAE